MKKIYSNDEIVDELLMLLDHPTKASLWQELDVSKQSLNQYAKQKGVDINNKIISMLIEKCK